MTVAKTAAAPSPKRATLHDPLSKEAPSGKSFSAFKLGFRVFSEVQRRLSEFLSLLVEEDNPQVDVIAPRFAEDQIRAAPGLARPEARENRGRVHCFRGSRRHIAGRESLSDSRARQ